MEEHLINVVARGSILYSISDKAAMYLHLLLKVLATCMRICSVRGSCCLPLGNPHALARYTVRCDMHVLMNMSKYIRFGYGEQNRGGDNVSELAYTSVHLLRKGLRHGVKAFAAYLRKMLLAKGCPRGGHDDDDVPSVDELVRDFSLPNLPHVRHLPGLSSLVTVPPNPPTDPNARRDVFSQDTRWRTTELVAIWLLAARVVACGYTINMLIQQMCEYLYLQLPGNDSLVKLGGRTSEYAAFKMSPLLLLKSRLQDPFLMAQMFACKCFHERFTEVWVHWTRSKAASQSQMLLVWLTRDAQLRGMTHAHWWWKPFNDFLDSCADAPVPMGLSRALSKADCLALREGVDTWMRQIHECIVVPELRRHLSEVLAVCLGHDDLLPHVARLMLRHADPAHVPASPPPPTGDVRFTLPDPRNVRRSVRDGKFKWRVADILRFVEDEIKQRVLDNLLDPQKWFAPDELDALKVFVDTNTM